MSSWATMDRRKRSFVVAGVVAAALIGYFAWRSFQPPPLPAGFTSSNGRLEGTEIDVAAKHGGIIQEELVDEGDLVTAGQVLVHMDIASLEAQRREAVAKLAMAKSSIETAQATLTQRESEKEAAQAKVQQLQAEFDLAGKLKDRAEQLVKTNAMSIEDLDTRRGSFFSAQAALSSGKANVAAAEAAIATAKAQIITAEANAVSAQATIDRIQADINDSTLSAPRPGRIQYRIAQTGEVLSPGGKVLNMVDLTDVYMTFFLPETVAGQVKQGADVRLVFDALPQYVIPAKVTFVADVSQFTPKTVETAEERQKLTFRIKAHIASDLLKQHLHHVKTGVPGVAYVQLDPAAKWPAHLEVKLPP